ncbi:Type 1 glutamine amidotransferase-like domain-containing protein [bacterium]|nr:Type 1 glutamine amidotransferase-like domain-containing protein [bacterium]
MSYTKFKKKSEFKEIFYVDAQIQEFMPYPNHGLNVILPSEHLFKSLKPILEKVLGGDLDNKKVVLIPNGGINEDRAHMSYVYLQQFTTINNMYLKQLDIENWPKKIILDALQDADVLVVSGGLVSRLLRSIDKANIRSEIVQMIKLGKPFVGFSAGAMCLSETTHFAENFIGESDPEVITENPLGVIDFEIYPHFEDNLYSRVEELLPKNIRGFAVRPTDAVIITEGKLLLAGAPIPINFQK